MTQAYSNPKRQDDPHALPDVEVFCVSENDKVEREELTQDGHPVYCEPGWYWWSCFPGCLPGGEPMGPFTTEAEALADAQNIEFD